jgi:hypothetical protein
VDIIEIASDPRFGADSQFVIQAASGAGKSSFLCAAPVS